MEQKVASALSMLSEILAITRSNSSGQIDIDDLANKVAKKISSSRDNENKDRSALNLFIAKALSNRQKHSFNPQDIASLLWAFEEASEKTPDRDAPKEADKALPRDDTSKKD